MEKQNSMENPNSRDIRKCKDIRKSMEKPINMIKLHNIYWLRRLLLHRVFSIETTDPTMEQSSTNKNLLKGYCILLCMDQWWNGKGTTF